MSRLHKIFIATLILVVALSASRSVAQTSKGTIAGVVRDPSGAVVPNASVTAASQLTGESRATTTNGSGEYRMEAIDPSIYTLTTEASGFQKSEVKGVNVRGSVVTSRNITLQVGAAASTVSVVAASNNINLDNGQLSGTVSGTDLKNLPIFSLNPIELASTIPGVQFVNPQLNLQGSGGNGEQIEVNGARPRSNNFTMDSQDINDISIGGQAFQPQIPDMFQSVAVLTNSTSAEYGRTGGAVVNLITKSGTNQFHGSAFELYSGSGLNSLDGQTRRGKPFPPGTPNPKARSDEHQFGFTLGGPIWKNKLFAFGGSQWSRFYGNAITGGTISSGSIELPDQNGYNVLSKIGGPNAALLQGLLDSGSYLSTYSNFGPGEIINVGQPTTGAANACPASGCLITTGQFLRPPVPQQQPDTQYMVRLDYVASEKDSLAGRYIHDNSNFSPDLALNTSGLPGFDAEAGGPSSLSFFNWTHVFDPHLLNEFRVSLTRVNFLFQATPQTLANPLSKNFNLNFLDDNLPELGISQNIPQGRKEDFYQFQDTVGWTRGKQSLRIGADVGRLLESDLVPQDVLGGLNITGGGGVSGMGNFLNDYLGASGYATKTFGPTRFDPRLWRSAGFIQDDIKLTPELTVNLGLRYDYLTDPSNSLPYPGLDVANPYAPITTVYKIHTDTANWGPRFGFAYAPNYGGWMGDGKTVVHGGIGIFYDTVFGNIAENSAESAPNASATTLISTSGAGLGNALGLLTSITPAPISPFSSVLSTDKNLVNPRTYQWNVGVERALPAELKLTVNYVGSRGRKLYANQQYNYFNPTTQERLNPARGDVSARANIAASQYDSIQTEVSRQFSRGFSFRAAYTFGKNMDDGSEVFDLFSNPNTSYSANLAPGGRRQDWGPSSFNFPQFFSIAYVWAPPGFHSDNHLRDLFLSGLTRHWSVAGVTQLQSGPPSTFTIAGLDTNGDGNAANDRPLVGNPHASISSAGIDGIYVGGTPGTYYDMAQANSPAGTLVAVNPSQVHWLVPYGPQFVPYEVGRNSFNNPGSTIWNLALEKDAPAPWTRLESATFQFRAEAQDVGNHNDVNTLNTNVLLIGTPNYLNVSNARASTSRVLRFWVKFSF